MPHPLQIELLGGPLAGRVHEVADPLGLGLLPAQIGLPDEADETMLHWYDVDEDTAQPRAKFIRSDPR
ncbi:MAG TPA: hypothetical protein VF595_17485 [Tepidisphaeraceae bacterium]|jgi:hypothetical protein